MKQKTKNLRIIFLLIFFFGLFGLAKSSLAATIAAESCAQDKVLAAVTAAAVGDTVSIPAGTCIWNASVTVNKAITIKGAGVSATILTPATNNTNLLTLNGAIRVTDIGVYFEGNKSGDADFITKGKGWRIDHCRFEHHNGGGYGITAYANGTTYNSFPSGLIDHNTLIDSRILADNMSFGAMLDSWKNEANLGPAGADETIYIEDNNLTRTVTGNVIDANRGARLVVRYNTVHNSEIMVHGRNNEVNTRGTRSWEIYGNNIDSDATVGGITPIFLRSGEGVIFNNTITGNWTWTSSPHLSNDASLSEYGTTCNGTDVIDGNTPGENGWLCRDQIGSGSDATTFTSTYPNFIVNWMPQKRSPAYIWGNSTPAQTHLTSSVHIQKNRDFFDSYPLTEQTSKNYPFDGTSGVGRGTLANRPDNCSIQSDGTRGVAYWATDAPDSNWNTKNGSGNDGALYVCTATNTWTRTYTPYVYPHPLQNEGPADNDTTPPTAPSGLKIN